MRASAKHLGNSTVLLEVEVEAERFDRALERAYRKLVKELEIPGFRKGRAPRPLVERYLGKERFRQEAAWLLLEEVYPEAVENAGIEPVSRPEIELVQVEEGKPLVFKAKVEVKPEVTLGEYKGIRVTRRVKEVTEEEVEAEIEKLRKRYARLVTVEEGEVQDEDIVTLDYKLTVGEEVLAEEKEREIEIGLGYLGPEVDAALKGARPGEEREVKINFPPEHPEPKLAGKEALLKVKVRSIHRRELLPLDDELAKEVSEFDTLEELRADIRQKLTKAAEEEADRQVRREVVEKVVANAQLELPPSLVEARTDELLEDVVAAAEGRGVPANRFFELAKTTPEEMRERLRPEAEQSLKVRLVLDAVAEAENLQVEEEEVKAEVEKIASLYRQDPERLYRSLEEEGRLELVRGKLRRDKAIDFLVSQAVIEEEAKAE
ncbi:trigger factor [Ammonifex degensii KC4]|uniref:Trigger factor n=1 Tax=Ammonifex degensii (strain DSM 10501 / KC4) TaxID=429009 RepID=C9RBL1_AMMDK|nr:trigger factor [Ammonifex degensii]ACX51638.1 trigger factor [Ammonifex degensii KC4]